MKKTYDKLYVEQLLVESEGGFMAGSAIDSVTLKVEVDDYDTFEMETIFN